MGNNTKEPFLDGPSTTMLVGVGVAVTGLIAYINSTDELMVPEQKDSSNKQAAFLLILAGLGVTYIGYKNAHKNK